ncbi:MAG: NUDIX domain-containing protein [Planctomycetes bacterium]|nr:NUDIX domain-containing protein [Planctomycetota bacterium]
MKTRTAAGFILARFVDGEPRYLLLRGARSGDWLPPKGHTDNDTDTVEATARRETEEEAGITELRVVQGFERSIEYDVETAKRGRYRKRVTYLLATTGTEGVTCSDEHTDAGWFGLDEAIRKISFEQMRDVLRAADAHLRATLPR